MCYDLNVKCGVGYTGDSRPWVIGDYPFDEITINPGIVTNGYTWEVKPVPDPVKTIDRKEAQRLADTKTDELPEMRDILLLIRECAERGGYSIFKSTKMRDNVLRAIASRLRSLGFSVEYSTYSNQLDADNVPLVKITVSWH